MKKLLVCFMVYLSVTLFALSKSARAQAFATKEYSVTPVHLTRKDGPPNPQLIITVLDENSKPFTVYALAINGVVIYNPDNKSPLAVPVKGRQSYYIECYVMMYKTVKLPPVFVKSDESMNVTINLTPDETPIKD